MSAPASTQFTTMPPGLPCRCHEAQTPVFGYLYQMVELGVMRLLLEKRVFDEIPDEGVSVADLAEKTGIEFNLLERMVNFLISSRIFTSSSPGYIHNTPTSKYFTQRNAQLWYPHIYDTFFVSAAKWPDYFDTNGMQEPQCSTKSPFGFGSGYPGKSVYEIFDLMPKRSSEFNATMSLSLGEMPILGMYDFSWIGEYGKRPEAKDRTLFVDVSGGKGQALKAIIEAFPSIAPEQCVLEDQGKVIEEAKLETGTLETVKKVPIDLFQEQPVKGALVYYIRRVLNDWTDAEVVQILTNVRRACAPDSKVLISENLLPDEPPLKLAAIDVWMLNFGGKRRNKRNFGELAKRAGFELSSIGEDDKTKSAVLELVVV